MTGYSFSTPVWDGGQWTRPEVAGVTAMARIVNGPEDQPRNAPVQWDRIDWRAQEEQVRRLRQRIFTAAREQDWPRVRNLQELTAPRGALSYPRLSREEFEGRFLGLMPYITVAVSRWVFECVCYVRAGDAADVTVRSRFPAGPELHYVTWGGRGSFLSFVRTHDTATTAVASIAAPPSAAREQTRWSSGLLSPVMRQRRTVAAALDYIGLAVAGYAGELLGAGPQSRACGAAPDAGPAQ